MASYNKVTLVGRMTGDPEVRNTTSGLKVAQFTVAVDRAFGKTESGEKKTDFFRCKAWRQKADFVEQYVGKGRLVLIEGRVELNDYLDKEGQKRFITEIDVANVETLDSRDRAGEAASSGGGSYDGGNRGGGSGSRDEGNGYFADDEPAPARQAPRAAAQPAPARPAQAQAARPAQAAPAQAAPAQAASAQAARKPAPATTYDDDFDDSDPFADE